MTTDDRLTRAERAADRYARHGTPAWGCFVDGFLAHAAQQPTREAIALALVDDGWKGHDEDLTYETLCHIADAVLSLFDGADR